MHRMTSESIRPEAEQWLAALSDAVVYVGLGGRQPGVVCVSDAASLERLPIQAQNTIYGIKLSANGEWLAAMSREGELVAWPAGSRVIAPESVTSTDCHAALLGFGWISNDSLLAFDAAGGVWRAFPFEGERTPERVAQLPSPVIDCYSTDDGLLIALTETGTFLMADEPSALAGCPSRSAPAPARPLALAGFTACANGHSVCYGSANGELVVFDWQSSRVMTRSLCEGPLMVAGVGADALLAIDRNAGDVHLVSLDLERTWPAGSAPMSAVAAAVCCTSAGPRLFVLDQHGRVAILRWENGEWTEGQGSTCTDARSLVAVPAARMATAAARASKRRAGELVRIIADPQSLPDAVEGAHAELVQEGYEPLAHWKRSELAQSQGDFNAEAAWLKRFLACLPQEARFGPRLIETANRFAEIGCYTSTWTAWRRARQLDPSLSIPAEVEERGALSDAERVLVDTDAKAPPEPERIWRCVAKQRLLQFKHAAPEWSAIRRAADECGLVAICMNTVDEEQHALWIRMQNIAVQPTLLAKPPDGDDGRAWAITWNRGNGSGRQEVYLLDLIRTNGNCGDTLRQADPGEIPYLLTKALLSMENRALQARYYERPCKIAPEDH